MLFFKIVFLLLLASLILASIQSYLNGEKQDDLD